MHRTRGRIAMVVAVIGFVLSIALAIGAVVGSGYIGDGVNSLAAAANDNLDRAVAITDNLSTTIGNANDRIADIEAKAQAALSGPQDTIQALVTSITTGLSGGLTNLQESVDNLQQLVSTAGRVAIRLGWTPSSDDLPGSRLAAISTAIDTQVANLATAEAKFGQGGDVTPISTAVSNAATALSTAVTNLQSTVDNLNNRIQLAQLKITNTANSLNTVVTIGTGVLVLFFLYVAFLHVVLFRVGRALTRPAAQSRSGEPQSAEPVAVQPLKADPIPAETVAIQAQPPAG
jgi:hypothetical protein